MCSLSLFLHFTRTHPVGMSVERRWPVPFEAFVSSSSSPLAVFKDKVRYLRVLGLFFFCMCIYIGSCKKKKKNIGTLQGK